jgi:hypothetical protein
MIETAVFGLDDTLVAAGRAYARAVSVLVADYEIDADTFVAAHLIGADVAFGRPAIVVSCARICS